MTENLPDELCRNEISFSADRVPSDRGAMMIRAATIADAPRLIEMAKAFLLQTRYGDTLRTNPDALEALVGQVLELGYIAVADVDGRLEGMLAVVELTNPISGDPYADELVWWVEPDARSRSIGPKLLYSAERWAHGRGLPLIKMVAPVGALAVAQFYRRRGYEPVETSYMKRLL